MEKSDEKPPIFSPITNSPDELVESARSFYSLNELAQIWHCTSDRILDLAMQGKLVLSVVANNWLVHGGGFDDEENTVEVPQWDQHLSGQIPLPIAAAHALFASNHYTIEYLPDTPERFTKIIPQNGESLPVITLEKIIITIDDVENFKAIEGDSTSDVPIDEIQKAKEISQYEPLCTNAIANLFVVRQPRNANSAQWKRWAKNAKKNELELIAKKGQNKGKAQALFYPDKVGHWLIKRGEKTPEEVALVLQDLWIE